MKNRSLIFFFITLMFSGSAVSMSFGTKYRAHLMGTIKPQWGIMHSLSASLGLAGFLGVISGSMDGVQSSRERRAPPASALIVFTLGSLAIGAAHPLETAFEENSRLLCDFSEDIKQNLKQTKEKAIAIYGDDNEKARQEWQNDTITKSLSWLVLLHESYIAHEDDENVSDTDIHSATLQNQDSEESFIYFKLGEYLYKYIADKDTFNQVDHNQNEQILPEKGTFYIGFDSAGQWFFISVDNKRNLNACSLDF